MGIRTELLSRQLCSNERIVGLAKKEVNVVVKASKWASL